MSFPRARSFQQVFTETLDGDAVLLVMDTMQYHTLTNGAYEVWLAADGHRDVPKIAARAFGDRTEASLRRVQQALDALSEAGLLDETVQRRPSRLNRRAATKGVAAAIVGGIGIPAVISITVPDSAAAVSRFGPRANSESCGVGLEGCTSGCCCGSAMESTAGICLDRSFCEKYPAYCI
jgi:hypothetical protein